ncbi:MAG: hypothetical protein ABIN36_16525 [Ferruginibacter sp.]
MSQHYQNKETRWSQEVAELEYVPGLAMPNPADSLRKLHKKLRDEKRNKRKIFFMLAAACFTVILFVPAVVQQNNQPPAPRQMASPNLKKTIIDPPIAKENKSVQQKVREPQKEMSPVPPPVIKVEKNEPLVILPLPGNILPTASDSPALNPITETAVAPMKRKYPVVHINSIKTPEGAEEVIDDIKNPFRRILNRPALPPWAVPVYSSEHVINKNKNSQN